MNVEQFNALKAGNIVSDPQDKHYRIVSGFRAESGRWVYEGDALIGGNRTYIEDPAMWTFVGVAKPALAINDMQVDQVIASPDGRRFLVTNRIDREFGHPIIRAICLTTRRHITVTNPTVWSAASEG